MCLIRSVHVQLQRIIPARSALSIRSSSSPHLVRVHQPIIDFQCFIVFYPGLGRIPFFELRSFGSNQHEYLTLRREGLNIFFSLIKAGICPSVCLHYYCVEKRSSNRLHACGCGPNGVQCRTLVQYGHATRSELINL